MKEHGGKLTKMEGRLGEMHRDVGHIASHGNKAAKEMRRMRENTKRTDQRIANIENMVSRALGQRNAIAEREMVLQDDQLESRNGVLALLMEQQSTSTTMCTVLSLLILYSQGTSPYYSNASLGSRSAGQSSAGTDSVRSWHNQAGWMESPQT
jgi:hypothetical protein